MNQQGVDVQQQQQQLSALLDGEYDYTRPRRGQVLYGEILSIGENEVIVDLGGKQDGIVRRRDLELLDDVYRTGLKVGERVPVYVLSVAGSQGELVISLNLGLTRQDWLRAQDLLESGGACQAEVTDVNRGGIIVQFGRLHGFVPNSHLTSVTQHTRGARQQQAKQGLLSQTLSLTVIEVDQERRRLVLSERAADWRKRQQLLEQLTEGEIRTGVVRNLVKFGAFVDLGGIDGLIHISEMDWKYVNHPNEVLSVGDEVEVYVLSVDRKQERVGLSRKRVLPDPWTLVTGELHVDQVVEGTVTSLTDFGVFVDLGRGVEGLVHVSEMPGGKAAHADLEPGSPIQVRVLEIDRWKRRIALSLRGTTQEPAPPVVEDAVPALVGIG